MLENGNAVGFLIGLIICVIFTIVVIINSKKESASTDAILQSLSEEQIYLIKNQTYTKTDGKDMFISDAFVVSVDDLGDKVKALLFFYTQEHQEFYTRKVKLSKEDAINKNVAAHNFVPALMKYNKDLHYYDYKKLV